MNKPPSQAPKRKCSYCGGMFEPVEKRWLPFCSRRCKEIDLSNWLTESYGLPFEGEKDEDDPDTRRGFFAEEWES